LTVRVRPWNWAPFMAAIASSAPSAISTKPKPRDRPVSRSMMTCARVTVPYWENASWRSSEVVPKGRLPTYKFLLMVTHSRPPHRAALDADWNHRPPRTARKNQANVASADAPPRREPRPQHVVASVRVGRRDVPTFPAFADRRSRRL